MEKQNILKTCAHCGKEFIAHKDTSLYCSIKCRNHESYIRNVRKNKQCPICGKEIKYGEGNKTYCSDECRDKAHVKICEECGKEFIPKYNGMYNDSARYCSAECANNAQRDRTVYTCKQCGKSFHRRNRGEDQCLFCSRACAIKYRNRELYEKWGEDIYYKRRS